MNGTYYIDEIPMKQIIATEKEINKRLYQDELKLACKCSPVPAFITLNLKNGMTVYVARERRWNSSTKKYMYHVQLLDEDVQVIMSNEYQEDNISGLTSIAIKIIRLNRMH